MKGVFCSTTALLGVFFLLFSCDIPDTEFEFSNNMGTDTVTITPDSGEDWDGFSLAPGGNATVKSENSNIFFTAMDGTDVIYLNQGYTYDRGNREYSFYDNP